VFPSLCPAGGHDVDPVDVCRLTLQTRLDSAYQRLDLGTVQPVVACPADHLAR
jgi:hypothetical protein